VERAGGAQGDSGAMDQGGAAREGEEGVDTAVSTRAKVTPRSRGNVMSRHHPIT